MIKKYTIMQHMLIIKKICIYMSICITYLLLNIEANAQDLQVIYENNQCCATLDGKKYRCSIGKNGVSNNKIEGDNCTPLGIYSLQEVFFREDKMGSTVKTKLPTRTLKPSDGWCDEQNDTHYNTLVDLTVLDPSISHEKMYRDDDLYDVVLVVGYNDNPPIPGKGSAIFVHIAREGYAGTAGCIGFSKQDLLEILSKLDNNSKIVIKTSS